MALIRLIDEKNARIVPAEKAAALWLVLTGEREGTDNQQAFAMRVKNIYMDWKHPATPKSYIQQHRQIIAPKVIQQGQMLESLPETDFSNGRKDRTGETQ